jgi:tetratricopeptide (TPR) repeat protein
MENAGTRSLAILILLAAFIHLVTTAAGYQQISDDFWGWETKSWLEGNPDYGKAVIYDPLSGKPINSIDPAWLNKSEDLAYSKGVPSYYSGSTSASSFNDNSRAGTMLTQANNLYAAGQFIEAKELYDKVIELNPNLKDAWIYRGDAMQAMGSLNQSLGSYQVALALDPNNADALLSEGNVLYSLRRYGDALDAYQAVINFRPKDVDAWNGKSKSLRAFGRTEEADDAAAMAKRYSRAVLL